MKVSEAMNPHAAIVRAHDAIRVAAETMVENHVTFLPVLGRDNQVEGTVTEHELVRHAVATGLDVFLTAVRHVANLEALTCSADEELSAAEQKMSDAHQTHILVVGGETGKTYLGLVTLGAGATPHTAAPSAA
jgi:CBS domain-containing protein